MQLAPIQRCPVLGVTKWSNSFSNEASIPGPVHLFLRLEKFNIEPSHFFFHRGWSQFVLFFWKEWCEQSEVFGFLVISRMDYIVSQPLTNIEWKKFSLGISQTHKCSSSSNSLRFLLCWRKLPTVLLPWSNCPLNTTINGKYIDILRMRLGSGRNYICSKLF